MRHHSAAVVLLLLLCLSPAFCRVGCIDETGTEVGWWVVFKKNDGLDYAYVDANNYPSSGPLKLVGGNLDCGTSCALGRTLHQLVGNTSVVRVSWNDDLPASGSTSSTSSASAASQLEEEEESDEILGNYTS